MQYLISGEKELNRWLKEYAPEPDDEELHFLFASASKNIGYVGYLIDTLIECITDEEINNFILQHKGEILLWKIRLYSEKGGKHLTPDEITENLKINSQG